jgi:uncharacterized protein (TIGR03663 family)
MGRRGAFALLLAVFICGLAFRLVQLDLRPFHNDEAVNATKVIELWEHGRYAYDPDEYHGPALHYATLPFLWLSGARNADELQDRILRLAPVFFGASLILLLLLFVDGLGWPAIVWAAFFTAISPAMVFYSRYFIHEMLLVAFTALALGAAWRYNRKPSPLWALAFGVAIGLMYATKETFVITIAAMVLAFAATNWRTLASPELRLQILREGSSRDLALGASAAVIVWLLFFSSFFTNWPGLLDSVRTYFPWLKRAAGQSPHLHPWYFYLQRLGWFHPVRGPIFSEALILILALLGAIVSLTGHKSLPRFLTFYTLILTAAYSAISYKTPWCMLSFLFSMILLAGFGTAWLIGRIQRRVARLAMTALLLAFSAQLTAQSWRASFTYSSDRRNPYVYAQTVPDVLKLVQRTEGLARVNPAGFGTILKVIAPKGDYWPLPWYLRRFKNIGWYDKLPDDPFAPIIIVSSQFDARLDEKSDHKWIMTGVTEMRPGKFFELYVELSLWKKYVETLPPEPE